MLARARIGLVIGIFGLVLNGLVSGFSGIAGTLLALLAGGIAGFFAARKGSVLSKREGARAGALAGGVAGGVVLIGQMLGAMARLFSLFSAEKASTQILYVLFGAGITFLLGAILILLAAGIGATVGYFVTPRSDGTLT